MAARARSADATATAGAASGTGRPETSGSAPGDAASPGSGGGDASVRTKGTRSFRAPNLTKPRRMAVPEPEAIEMETFAKPVRRCCVGVVCLSDTAWC